MKVKYPDNREKIKENVDAEILGVITSEALEFNKKVYEVDTSRSDIDQNVNDIIKILNDHTKDYGIGLIDWLEKYEKRLLK